MTEREYSYLVVADGMLDVDVFNALDLVAKEAYLNGLTPIRVRAQASVIAVAGRRTVKQVLDAWQYTGIISSECARAALKSKV